VLRRAREVALSGYMHQDVPFEKVVEALRPERKMAHAPLFQVKFVLQNVPEAALELPGLLVTPLDTDMGTAKIDLQLNMQESALGLICIFDYSTDLFYAETIVRLAGNFKTLLNQIVSHPEARIASLEVLTEAEKKQEAAQRSERDEAKRQKFKSIKPKAVSITRTELIG
jgi:non-ribosomal peptide synthetase component F